MKRNLKNKKFKFLHTHKEEKPLVSGVTVSVSPPFISCKYASPKANGAQDARQK
jgi:hypothetical protein